MRETSKRLDQPESLEWLTLEGGKSRLEAIPAPENERNRVC